MLFEMWNGILLLAPVSLLAQCRMLTVTAAYYSQKVIILIKKI
jgi:hypothetical protein